MRNLIIILFLLASVSLKSQQRFPTGFPTQANLGWNKWGYAMSDSGLIVANRDTNWLAKYSGTIVFKPSNKKFYWFDSTTLTWNGFADAIDTTSLSNRINLKLNITDTTNRWWGIGKRWADTLYRVNDSTVGYTINGLAHTFEIKGRASSEGGSGTVTSVGLSMPSAFNVTPSSITTSGTFAVSGAGTGLQYIRGNGTLATTDTGMIPNFHLKVRSLITGTSPITFNQTTGAIGINNANVSGTKGAATFNPASFSDNGSGLISLTTIVSAGGCTNCDVTIGADGRITAYSNGDSPGITSLNSLTASSQNFAVGTGGTDFNISSSGSTHTFNFPSASAFNRGLLTASDWTVFNNKLSNITGLIEAGTNITISGNGITGDPYIINSSGGGGGTNNANIGPGFRWLNGVTQELRTVANSSTITWDSTSTANTLTGKVDTSVIATQYDLTQLSGNFIQNQTATIQDATFAITGPMKLGTIQAVDPRLKMLIRDNSVDTSGFAAIEIKTINDDEDLNVDGAVIVKHDSAYKLTPGYGNTLQVYTLAGSDGTIVGNNNYVGVTTPYAPGENEISNGYVRFELGPIWPKSEKMRLNNRGDIIFGWTKVRSHLASQAGTTVTDLVNSFSASDVGKFFCWGDRELGGTAAFADRITGYIDANNITVETNRTISIQGGRVCIPNAIVDTIGNALYRYVSLDSIKFSTDNATSFFQFNPFADTLRLVRKGAATDAAFDVTGGIAVARMPRDLYLMGTTYSKLHFRDATHTLADITANSTGTTLTTLDNVPINLNPNSTPVATITGTKFQSFKPTIISGIADVPIAKLDVRNPDGNISAYFENTRGTGTNFAVIGDVTGAGSENRALYGTVNGGTVNKAVMVPSTSASGTNDFAISSETTAKSYFAGKVGIGISAPSDELHVIGKTQTDSLAVNHIIQLPFTRSADTGVVYVNGIRFIHNYQDRAGQADGQNTFVGLEAGNFTMGPSGGAVQLGGRNVGIGYKALQSNTTGWQNTAVGHISLQKTTTGIYNTAVGAYTLVENTTGNNNTGIGADALWLNTTGTDNTGVGTYVLQQNTTGTDNTAVGSNTMMQNLTGANNVAIGKAALKFNQVYSYNTAVGYHSMENANIGSSVGVGAFTLRENLAGGNTAVGTFAAQNNTTGSNKTAIGSASMANATTGSDNTGVGALSFEFLTTGDGNTGLGQKAGDSTTTGNDNIFIGNNAGDNNVTGSRHVVISTDGKVPAGAEDGSLNIQNVIFGANNTATGQSVSTGRIGIRVKAPTQALHVNGQIRLDTAAIAADSDSAFVWNRTNNTIEYAKINGGGSATTVYTGDGTVTGNRNVNVNNLNITFSDVNTFRINHDVFAQSRADGTFPYSNVITAPTQQLWMAYTPVAGIYSKGAAVIIDTNNNVSLGSGIIPSNAPLYTSGSAYIQGLQSSNGNFYRVTSITADQTLNLTNYWLEIDATSGNITITLPSASTAFGSSMGIQYVLRRVDASGNTVTVVRAGSDTINGTTSFTLTTQYAIEELQCVSASAWALRQP